MRRKEFIGEVANHLREEGKRKPVSVKKQVFHISDDEGNSKDFVVKKTDKTVMYTLDDVANILDSCISVMKGALMRGDCVALNGVGVLGLKKHKSREAVNPRTGEAITVPAHYVVRFVPGNEFKRCPKVFEQGIRDGQYIDPDENLREMDIVEEEETPEEEAIINGS